MRGGWIGCGLVLRICKVGAVSCSDTGPDRQIGCSRQRVPMSCSDPSRTSAERLVQGASWYRDADGHMARTAADRYVNTGRWRGIFHAVARQTALAASSRACGKLDVATWASHCADWTALNVVERLLPTGYSPQLNDGIGGAAFSLKARRGLTTACPIRSGANIRFRR
jgi:hypothetical protein